MPQSYPSVQSFYKREVPTGKEEVAPTAPDVRGDGFTEEELADALDPMSRRWNPEREYEEVTIDKLHSGPKPVTFAGRIISLNTILGSSQKESKASGWHYMIVKDDTAATSIKLYFARTPYPLKLGQLLSFWTCFVSDPPKDQAAAIVGINIYANIFPGRVTSDHIIIHANGNSTATICRAPLGYQRGQPLPGLMTLNSYLSSGHDGVTSAKILVCVKSIGATKKIPRKTGGESELLDVLLFDHTGEVRMTLWSEMIKSAKNWQPGNTILLVSNPGYKVGYSSPKGTIGILRQTMIDVDPVFPDAEWLRKYAIGLTKKESLLLEFPEGVWDIDAAENGVIRPLFTLAELDIWVRADENQVFTGLISLTIMEMSLVSYHRRNMLMCAECCGIPTYSNTPTSPCLHCTKPLTLHINPKIIGTLLDETGCIAPGKLLWSNRAWEQLFGRDIADIADISLEEARQFEMRIVWMRLLFVVGWEAGVGRLAILGVKSPEFYG